jgi:hypothetical protein
VTTNDESVIRSSSAERQDMPDELAVEQDLAEFHAAYAALKDDPAAVSRLDVLFADAAFGAPEAVTSCEDSAAFFMPSHGPMERWAARPHHRLILALAPHPQALDRILDVLPLVEADHRVQVVFASPAAGYQWAGVERRVRDLGGVWIPWQQAQQMRFDLILAASPVGIRDMTGPVVLMSHGIGAVRSRNDPWANPPSHSLDRDALVVEDELVPATLVLAHEEQLSELAETCPEAVPRARVMGDLSFDRLLAGQPYRESYREALGVQDGQRVVVVSSTWTEGSLFGTHPEIFTRLVAELPAEEYQVIGVLHPFVWDAHGRRQVLAWLNEARVAGLNILPPETDWRAAAIAADLVVGDHGSTTFYAAGLNVPVLLHTSASATKQPDGAATRLAQLAPPLHSDRPLLPQISQAINDHNPQRYAPITESITSRPGQAGQTLRTNVYRLLNLSEPNHAAPVSPVPLPTLLTA